MARLSGIYWPYSTLILAFFNHFHSYWVEHNDASGHTGGQGSGQQPSGFSAPTPAPIAAPPRFAPARKGVRKRVPTWSSPPDAGTAGNFINRQKTKSLISPFFP